MMPEPTVRFKNGRLWINPNREDFKEYEYWSSIETNEEPYENAIHIRLMLIFQLSTRSDFGILGATLYSTQDKIFVELPQSYKDEAIDPRYPTTILEAANRQLKETPIQSGRLTFDYRMYHPAESNPFIFAVLAKSIVNFFTFSIEKLDEQTVKEVVQQIYKQDQGKQ